MASNIEFRGHGDEPFVQTIRDVLSSNSELVETRNSLCYRGLLGETSHDFYHAPIVTVRKIAFYKALEELQWFLHGTSECPAGLRDTWWRGQLNPEGQYLHGYGDQIQRFGSGFNQIDYIVEGLKKSPNSRRLCLTTWNPEQMAVITEANQNKNTPTTCHLSFVQFQISRGKLYVFAFQRSGDLLLGVPHNWVQLWCLSLWIAARVGVKLGRVKWVGGDIHIYNEESHLQVVKEISAYFEENRQLEEVGDIVYTPTDVNVFNPRDFKIEFKYLGNAVPYPSPVTYIRPKLL